MNMTRPAGPRPFTRVITTPPGLPWDQARMAGLEARHTSPVSGVMVGDDLHIVVKRLGGWKPGGDGRFVAVYLRSSDIQSGQSLQVEVQGQTVSIPLPAQGPTGAISEQGVILIAGVVIVACLIVQIDLLWQRRQDAEARLSAVEAVVERQGRDAVQLAAAKADARDLTAMGVKGRTVDAVLKDLTTISLARDPDARIQAFSWDDGQWSVEVAGSTPPVSIDGLDLQRSAAPVRPNVWVWTPATAPVQGGE
jgi:hypothetical protein